MTQLSLVGENMFAKETQNVYAMFPLMVALNYRPLLLLILCWFIPARGEPDTHAR